MKTMKSILRFSLILFLCLFLTGAAYILTAAAKITPKPDMEGTTLITIVKGDTLWGPRYKTSRRSTEMVRIQTVQRFY